MNGAERIRLARRRARFSQEALANQMGVRRSATAIWEAGGGANPTSTYLEQLAHPLQVAYGCLTAGRGDMKLPDHWHGIRGRQNKGQSEAPRVSQTGSQDTDLVR